MPEHCICGYTYYECGDEAKGETEKFIEIELGYVLDYHNHNLTHSLKACPKCGTVKI